MTIERQYSFQSRLPVAPLLSDIIHSEARLRRMAQARVEPIFFRGLEFWRRGGPQILVSAEQQPEALPRPSAFEPFKAIDEVVNGGGELHAPKMLPELLRIGLVIHRFVVDQPPREVNFGRKAKGDDVSTGLEVVLDPVARSRRLCLVGR